MEPNVIIEIGLSQVLCFPLLYVYEIIYCMQKLNFFAHVGYSGVD